MRFPQKSLVKRLKITEMLYCPSGAEIGFGLDSAEAFSAASAFVSGLAGSVGAAL